MWRLEPQISMGLWWALAALGGAVIAYYAWKRDWQIGRGRTAAILLLSSLGILLPLLVALNPTYVKPLPPPPSKPKLSLLLDGSLSMKINDVATGTNQSSTRWRVGLDSIWDIPSVEALEVTRQAFDFQLFPLPTKDSKEEWPRGHRTDLLSALRESVREGAEGGQAVLLVSDGAHNVGSVAGLLAFANEARTMDVPIYTVTLGTDSSSNNLSLAAKSPRMIAFPNSPFELKARIGQSGLAGETVRLSLFEGDAHLETRTIQLTDDPTQEITFHLDGPSKNLLQRYRIVAEKLDGEATDADNQTSVLVQRLDAPIQVLLLEGKPYWDTKFLARNLAIDPKVELTSIVRMATQRFLKKKYPNATPNSSDENKGPVEPAAEWTVEKEGPSPLEDPVVLDGYRLLVLGRSSDIFLTDRAVENLRRWMTKRGGCLICARGAPGEEATSKIAELLPVRWDELEAKGNQRQLPSRETHFRTQVSQFGFDAAVFEPLLQQGSDPLSGMPSLAASYAPKMRPGIPQVLLQSVVEQGSQSIPVVTYQPFGSGQSIVVEGAGMWRWAFLPPQHASKDTVYPTLWQSMIQWIISQQELLPGQKVGIRSDRASFLTGDRVSATLLVQDANQRSDGDGNLGLEVVLEGPGLPLAKRVSPTATSTDDDLFRVDFGAIDVGYYAVKVVDSSQQVLAETALEVRDPWFENLETEARPDIMRRLANQSGGEVLKLEELSELPQRFQKRLEARRPQVEERTKLWDKPYVLLGILCLWACSWIVRRRSGLV